MESNHPLPVQSLPRCRCARGRAHRRYSIVKGRAERQARPIDTYRAPSVSERGVSQRARFANSRSLTLGALWRSCDKTKPHRAEAAGAGNWTSVRAYRRRWASFPLARAAHSCFATGQPPSAARNRAAPHPGDWAVAHDAPASPGRVVVGRAGRKTQTPLQTPRHTRGTRNIAHVLRCGAKNPRKIMENGKQEMENRKPVNRRDASEAGANDRMRR